MAELVDMAGEGMPTYLWSQMAGADETPFDVGEQRAQRESGGFSYRNTILRIEDSQVAAALIGYALPNEPETINYDEIPPMFVPLQQLEDLAPGTWYVNVLAAYPQFRGKGLGSSLLTLAESLAIDSACSGISMIVSDGNTGARRLYRRSGYSQVATRPMVKETWQSSGKNWLLLTKTIADS